MEIAELEDFFNNCELPETPLMLNPATEITDLPYFLSSHFMPLKANPTSKVNQGLLYRLKALKLLIESNA